MTARGERMRHMTLRHKLLIAAIIAYLIVPTLVVVPISFSAGSTFKFPPESFSLQWWQRLIESEQWLRAALNSLKVGAIAAPLATVMGTAAAFGLSRVAPEKRNRLLGFIAAPLIIPKILVALAVYGAFLTFRLNGTLIGIALGHTAIAIPYVVVAVLTRLYNHDHRLADAAKVMGATPWRTFRRVTLPLIAPGILSGAALAFVVSFDELVIALFLQSPATTTLPVLMFSSVVYNIDLAVAAASTLFVVVVSAVMFAAQLISLRRRGGLA